MMSRVGAVCVVFLSACGGSSSSPPAAGGGTPADGLQALFGREWEWRLNDSPLLATSIGDHRYDDRLPDVSAEAFAERRKRTDAFLQELRQIDRTALSSGDRINYDMFKAQLYLIVLWPSICLLMGSFLAAAAQWTTNRHRALVRLIALAMVVTFSGVVLLEGRRAYRVDLIESRDASRYLDVGAKIRAHLPGRAVVLGPNRWWWALHDHDYLSLNNIWRQWQLASESGGAEPRFSDWIAATGARYILTNNDTRADLLRFPEPLQRQFREFLDTNCRPVGYVNDPNYFVIEIYEVK